MNNAIYRISLDVNEVSSQVSLMARRGETGRSILANLTEEGRPYLISEGCTAEFVCTKPDGNKLKNTCVIEDNVIRYDLTKRTVMTAGICQCEFRLTDATGALLATPRFRLEVWATIYGEGDATESEIANANTVKSANPAYAEVFMWSDGNPENEDRVGYFVTGDMERSAAMVKKCDGTSNIRGVSMAAPGFASNAPGVRYDDNSALRPQFVYVGLLGFAPVIDNGTCAVNGRCRASDDGTAVPDASGGGYLVVERMDESHVLVLLEPTQDIMLRVDRKMEERLSQVVKCFFVTIGTGWTGKDAPYTQTIAVEGILTTDRPKICPVYSEDGAEALAQDEAWKMVSDADTGDGTITFRCLEDKPEVAIPIQIEVHR